MISVRLGSTEPHDSEYRNSKHEQWNENRWQREVENCYGIMDAKFPLVIYQRYLRQRNAKHPKNALCCLISLVIETPRCHSISVS